MCRSLNTADYTAPGGLANERTKHYKIKINHPQLALKPGIGESVAKLSDHSGRKLNEPLEPRPSISLAHQLSLVHVHWPQTHDLVHWLSKAALSQETTN